jgi:hypothetical protein
MIVADEKIAFDGAASVRQSSGIFTRLARRAILATVKTAEYRPLDVGDAAGSTERGFESWIPRQNQFC